MNIHHFKQYIFAVLAVVLVGCVPIVKNTGVPELPELWIPTNFSSSDEIILVLPMWSTLTGIASPGISLKPTMLCENPFFIAGDHLKEIPSIIGTKLNTYLLGLSVGGGRKNEFEGMYLISENGKMLLLIAADMNRKGPTWRAMLSAHINEKWRTELLKALESKTIQITSENHASIWSAKYKVLPPQGSPEYVVKSYSESELHFPDRGLTVKFDFENKKSIREFINNIQNNSIQKKSEGWRQIITN